MNITIQPGKLSGTVSVPASKSCAHRALICAALSGSPTQIFCGPVGKDVQATICCLRALSAKITQTETGYRIEPFSDIPEKAILFCGESGTTLRFLLPLAGALGVEASFVMEGRLPFRPVSALWEEMERMGCLLSRPAENIILCRGKLRPGRYRMSGNVSSQFLSGLMMALHRLPDSTLTVDGPVKSEPYVQLTKSILEQFPADCFTVEADWSSAAFFLSANALGSRIALTGLKPDSCQADRAITALLAALEYHCTVSAADIPDLIPILAVVASCKQGAVFTDTDRLRLKESDRVASISSMLTALGGQCSVGDNLLTVHPVPLLGGTVDCFRDHRIAMAAAIAATVCQVPVTIINAESTEKSYPHFWDDYKQLGGILWEASTERV